MSVVNDVSYALFRLEKWCAKHDKIAELDEEYLSELEGKDLDDAKRSISDHRKRSAQMHNAIDVLKEYQSSGVNDNKKKNPKISRRKK